MPEFTESEHSEAQEVSVAFTEENGGSKHEGEASSRRPRRRRNPIVSQRSSAPKTTASKIGPCEVSAASCKSESCGANCSEGTCTACSGKYSTEMTMDQEDELVKPHEFRRRSAEHSRETSSHRPQKNMVRPAKKQTLLEKVLGWLWPFGKKSEQKPVHAGHSRSHRGGQQRYRGDGRRPNNRRGQRPNRSRNRSSQE